MTSHGHKRSKHRNESKYPDITTMTTVPESIDSEPSSATNQLYPLDGKSAIRHNTAPIHHHIAPAIAAPFMQADGLIHRGI
jgi:hypothetical protein